MRLRRCGRGRDINLPLDDACLQVAELLESGNNSCQELYHLLRGRDGESRRRRLEHPSDLLTDTLLRDQNSKERLSFLIIFFFLGKWDLGKIEKEVGINSSLVHY